MNEYRDYNQINMEQLLHDIYAQNWNPIYETFDPELQIQHFNSIIRWLFGIAVRESVKRSEVNPWYNNDVKRAIVERDIAYRYRTRYREQRKKVNSMVRNAKRLYTSHFFLDLN
jgi:hypothetical protein